jgi:hypothetical protein
VLEESLPALAAAGVSVQVCVQTAGHRGSFAGMPTSEPHVLTRKPRAGLPASRWSPVRIVVGLEWRARRLLIRRAGPVPKLWLRARTDPWFRAAVQESQVIVAMDRHSIYTAWRANRLKGQRRAFYGLPAALRHLSVSASEIDPGRDARSDARLVDEMNGRSTK